MNKNIKALAEQAHLAWADIMCESKGKNLASFSLYERAKELGLTS